MSAFVLVFAIFACITGLFGGDARAYVRKRLAARKAQTPLLPERQRQLVAAEWLEVFRETVVAAEGEVPPDLDAFLTSATVRDRILADAEKERDRIFADAERARDKMLDGVLPYSDEAFAAVLYNELRLKWHRFGFALLVEWQHTDEKQREMWTTIATAVRVLLKQRGERRIQEDVEPVRALPKPQGSGGHVEVLGPKPLSKPQGSGDIDVLGSAHSQSIPLRLEDSERYKALGLDRVAERCEALLTDRKKKG